MTKMKTFATGTFALMAVVVLAGCGGGSGAGDGAAMEEKGSSMFPMTEDAKNVQNPQGPESANYQTDMSIADIAAFYREALGAQGMTERTINTVENDTVLNLVMDGHESGKALIVQVTNLPSGQRNVNVRFEEI